MAEAMAMPELPATRVQYRPTIGANGTKMAMKWIGGTNFKGDVASEFSGKSEFILAKNTNYLLIGTALADAMSMSMGADWWEHTEE